MGPAGGRGTLFKLTGFSDGLSDHHTVIVDFSRTVLQSKHHVCYRPIFTIYIDAFKVDILKSDLMRDPKGHLSDL